MSKSIEAKYVSLKERIKALNTQIKRTEEAGEKALSIETKELRRRLGELNGEAGRLKEQQDTSVSREKFEIFKEDLNKAALAKDIEINRRFKALEDAAQIRTGAENTFKLVWGAVVAIGAGVISYLARKF